MKYGCSNHLSICIDVVCPTLTAPMNGLITYAADTTSPFDYQTTAIYSCDTGYGLSIDDSVRTCVSSGGPGEWNGTEPTCEGTYNSYIANIQPPNQLKPCTLHILICSLMNQISSVYLVNNYTAYFYIYLSSLKILGLPPYLF